MNVIALAYGRGHLDVTLPETARPSVIRKQQLAKLSEPQRAVIEALSHPVSSQPLAELAKGRTSACILICDITRPCCPQRSKEPNPLWGACQVRMTNTSPDAFHVASPFIYRRYR